MCAIADPIAEEATTGAATFTGFISFNSTTVATATGTWSLSGDITRNHPRRTLMIAHKVHSNEWIISPLHGLSPGASVCDKVLD